MKKNIKKISIFSLVIIFNNIIINCFHIKPLKEVLKKHPEISYQKVCDEITFNMPPLEIASSFPHEGIFKELFIISIPDGIAKGLHGYILVDNAFIQELTWGELDGFHNIFTNAQSIDTNNIINIPGKVAVITQVDPKNYGHFILEILGRLAVLEMSNIEYDYIYVPYEIQPYIQQLFELWNFDISKIISPCDNDFTIQAETLICPSFNINTDRGYRHGGNFHHPETLKYIRNKLLKSTLEKNIEPNKFNKKVFISRDDTPNGRKIANEQEVFNLFKTHGFEKYILSQLSVAEQIILFHNAEIIICENGAGLSNIMFCQPNTQIVEIFQNFVAMDFWQCAYVFNLNYRPINTLLGDEANFYSDWHSDFNKLFSFPNQPIIPLEPIKKIIETL